MTDFKLLEESTYNHVKDTLEQMLSTGLPNLKGFENELRNLNKRIKVIREGVVLASDEHEYERAEEAMARLKGRHRAFKDVLANIRKKIRETSK